MKEIVYIHLIFPTKSTIIAWSRKKEKNEIFDLCNWNICSIYIHIFECCANAYKNRAQTKPHIDEITLEKSSNYSKNDFEISISAGRSIGLFGQCKVVLCSPQLHAQICHFYIHIFEIVVLHNDNIGEAIYSSLHNIIIKRSILLNIFKQKL